MTAVFFAVIPIYGDHSLRMSVSLSLKQMVTRHWWSKSMLRLNNVFWAYWYFVWILSLTTFFPYAFNNIFFIMDYILVVCRSCYVAMHSNGLAITARRYLIVGVPHGVALQTISPENIFATTVVSKAFWFIAKDYSETYRLTVSVSSIKFPNFRSP